MEIAAPYVKFVGKTWYLILLLWVGVLIIGVLHGPQFFNNTDDIMPETPSTPSAEANAIMKKFFPASIEYTPWVLVIQCPKDVSSHALDDEPFQSRADLHLTKGCEGEDGKVVVNKEIRHMVEKIQQELFDKHPDTFEPMLTASYWSLEQSEYVKLLPRFLSEDGLTTYVQWSAKREIFSSIRQRAYFSTLRHIIPKYRKEFAPSAYVYVTGGDPLTRDVTSQLMILMLKTNAVIIPIALTILIYMVGSWRLLIITGVSLGLVVFGAFGISDLIANMTGQRPPSITTQMIEVISVAITIDYALFMFTRFVTEMKTRRKRWFFRHHYYLKHYASQSPLLAARDYLVPPTPNALTYSGSFQQNPASNRADPHDLDVLIAPPSAMTNHNLNINTSSPSAFSRSLSSYHPNRRSSSGTLVGLGDDITSRSGELYMGLAINPAFDSKYDPSPDNPSPSEAILFSSLVATVENSGHVVLVSGSTLIVAFCGFFISRNAFLIEPAIFTGMGVVLAMISALTLVPALIQLFPRFFSDFNPFPEWMYRCCCPTRRRHALFDCDEHGVEIHQFEDVLSPNDDDYDDYKLLFSDMDHDATSTAEDHHSDGGHTNNSGTSSQHSSPAIPSTVNTQINTSSTSGYSTLSDTDNLSQTPASTSTQDNTTKGAAVVNLTRFHKSMWYRFGRYLVKKPHNIIVLLFMYVLMAWLASYIWKMDLSSAYSLGLPRGSKAHEALVVLQSAFPPGIIQPFFFTLVFTPPGEVEPPGPVFNDKLFQFGSTFVKEMMDYTQLEPSNFLSPFYWDGEYIDSIEKASTLLNTDKSYQFVWLSNVSPLLPYDKPTLDPAAVRISLFHSISPENSKILSFIHNVRRDVLDRFNQQDRDLHLYFAGYKVQEIDSINSAQETFPVLLVATTAMVITVVALLLRSAFVPVRLLLTLVLPIGATFGLAVLIYQYGLLDWTQIRCLQKTDLEAFFWNIPIFSAIVLISLALDYDLFLILRIMEYRSKAFTNKASILLALYDTGGIINSAGIIMALTFSSLLFFPADAVNQLGWLLVSSVLVDTFIVRPIIVPCVMAFADRISWWPSQVPWTNLKDVRGVIVVDADGNDIVPDSSESTTANSHQDYNDSETGPDPGVYKRRQHEGDVSHLPDASKPLLFTYSDRE